MVEISEVVAKCGVFIAALAFQTATFNCIGALVLSPGVPDNGTFGIGLTGKEFLIGNSLRGIPFLVFHITCFAGMWTGITSVIVNTSHDI